MGLYLASTLPPTERQRPAERPGPKSTPPGSRETHLADPLLGRLIAERYRVLELIGRGGMGVVYKAEHTRIGKVLALKLLTGELTRDAAQVARFKREAEMSSRLSHPNTVQVFDFGEADGLAYLAMEYVRGRDLGRVLSDAGRLEPERVARIVIQVCSSLAEAHDKGIVHRDLKPENVMLIAGLGGEDLAKVLDFGLAKLRESSELNVVTSSGVIVGTPYYMAPEQIRGESVTPACDVYALGALLYSCLTGTVPFDATTPIGVLTRHLTEEPQPLRARVPNLAISASFERIVLTALAKEPSQRFSSASALQRALVGELGGGDEAGVSVDALLDSDKLSALAPRDDAATRDEVENYERKLRRRGWITGVVAASLGLLTILTIFRAYRSWSTPPAFQGFELEPNNAASEARLLPFPLDVRGHLGQRLDRERGDRDFFHVAIPEGDSVRLSFEGLPNLASCVWLYPPESTEPFARYCTGLPGLGLDVPALRLSAGTWLVAIMQDRDPYLPTGAPPVYENVSDEYRFRLEPTRAVAEHEVEPNDAAPLGNTVAAGATLRGALAWTRDVDLVCAAAGPKRLRFVVEDGVDRPRDHHSVLEVTSRGGPETGVPVRVHRAGASVKPSGRDALGAWKGPWISLEGSEPPCIELTLTPNPWGPSPPVLAPYPGPEEYLVRVEAEGER
jgi:serine/threonine-protein kinase